MKQYRLLRNNRESGPFTAAQLISSGLKAYDLLWEEGRSAAWRYPSEIDEFKAVAPPVEEQPFDRFFRRKTEQAAPAEVTTSATTPKDSNTVVTAPAQPKPRIRIKADTRKIETKQEPVTAVVLPKEQPAAGVPRVEKSNGNQPIQWESAWMDWEQEKKAASVLHSKQESDTTPTVHYSRSLDDIKEQYVARVLNRDNAAHFLIRYKHYLALGIIAFTVLGTGIWLGMRWSKEQAEIQPVMEESQPAVLSTDVQTDETTTDLSGSHAVESYPQEATQQQPDVVIIPVQQRPAAGVTNTKKVSNQQQGFTEKPAAIKKTAAGSKTQPAVTRQPVVLQKQPAPVDNEAQQQPVNKTVQQEVTTGWKPRTEPAISDFVEVRNTQQGYGATGVQYKVANVSDKAIELIMIDLLYLDAAGRFMKGQTVYVRNLGAGETKLIKAPDDATASGITCKIAMVTSEKDNLYLIAAD